MRFTAEGFRVGQRVLRDDTDERGCVVAVQAGAPYPLTVRLDDGQTRLLLPWEAHIVPASRSIEDIEEWLCDD